MAVMVHHGLFVGSAADTYKFSGSILHCAKEPWFTDAYRRHQQKMYDDRYGVPFASNTVIRIGYNEMALNLVDAVHHKYFNDITIDPGLEFITERMSEGDAVLVHCNMGVSRSPSIALLWMWEHGYLDPEFRYALPQFKKLYPAYQPGNGFWHYLKARIERSSKVG